MYPKTLYPKTKQVLDKLKELDLVKNWYLAGGTGLALQLGHRKSIDLDFFIDKFPKRDLLLSSLNKLSPKIIQEAPGTIDTTIDEVKVSFLEYKYPLLNKFADFEGVSVASVSDIACMKLSAISSRGSKKDFVDLYFILQKHSLDELFVSFEKKFKDVKYQKLHFLKSLVYFDDANKDPDPDMIEEVSWTDIKAQLTKHVQDTLPARNTK
jgi:hypothetical protein